LNKEEIPSFLVTSYISYPKEMPSEKW